MYLPSENLDVHGPWQRKRQNETTNVDYCTAIFLIISYECLKCTWLWGEQKPFVFVILVLYYFLIHIDTSSILRSARMKGKTMPLDGLQLGHYRLIQPIGGGGMGEVYLAADTRINRQVAIKVVRTEVEPYPDAYATRDAAHLFQREMKAIAMLDHPHILPLYDFGEEIVNKAKLTYMVMPFRPEGSLVDWLQQRGRAQMLSPQDLVHIISQAADALQHAHDHQLIHQDVKPSNFLIHSRADNSGHPDLLLADFGIAKFTTATTTTSQSIRGTPAFMAPEQWDGQPVPATDQYALAVMAYQLLTGRLPFQGSPGQVMRQHFMTPPQPPGTFNPHISPTLDAVILRALAKQPADRFPSIITFAQAFQAAAQGKPITSVANTQGLARGADIRATLAISRREALIGANRTLTLPGGRQISLSLPEGMLDGQVICLEGLGELPGSGGPPGALILTIAIKQADESLPVSNTQTLRASNPLLQTVAPHATTTDPTVYASTIPGNITTRRSGLSTGMTILLVGVVLVVIAASVGLFFTVRPTQTASNPTTTTATASPQVTPSAATASPQVTPTTQVDATATFIAQNRNPYPPYTGTLVLKDPLSDNSRGYQWGEGADNTGGCQFTGGTYHASVSNGAEICTAHNAGVSNFAFEVQMTIIRGDCGGLVFRADLIQANAYLLRVCTDGYYKLFFIANQNAGQQLIPPRFSAAINTGLDQTNLITIVANGNTITLYVNRYQIATISDSTLPRAGDRTLFRLSDC